MKKKDKIVTGLIIGGAIASVLGASWVKKRSKEGDSEAVKDNLDSPIDDSLIKPKRKGLILRFLDWLDKDSE